MTTAQRTGANQERLHWNIDLRGRSRGVDLFPAVFGKSVTVKIDGRRVGGLAKPTPQRPWSEAAFTVDREPVSVGLTWQFPVMHTDVFVRGRSARDGRPIEVVRADAPAALSNYEVWFGAVFMTPFIGSRPRPPRWWPVVVVASVLIWVIAFVLSPAPPALRLPGAGALVVSGIVVVLTFMWSMLEFGERVHHALLARPSLGDWRVAVWFAAFFGYTLAGLVVMGLFLAALSQL
jgi:hypothetical protein